MGIRSTVVTPFEGDGPWLKCGLHAHTTNSDGELAPELLARHYEWAGYDVLATTDHWVRTETASTERLLVIPSAELDAEAGSRYDNAHVLALGLEAEPQLPEGRFEPVEEVVRWIAANGGVPYLAHTYWSGLRTDRWEACAELVGVEVWNAGCELEVGRGDSSLHWDEALERGARLYGIATDDSHHPGFDSGFAWVWARCAERSREAVLDALRTGAFYSSTGPRLDAVELEDGALVVRCSPAASVTLVCERRRGARANAGRLGYPHDSEVLDRDAAGLVTAVRLRRPPGATFARVVVEDANGRRAWTNPHWD